MDKIAKTIIGKDIIESLTIGMYEDPKFVYREYIQNSADQIDKAVMEGIIANQMEGHIEISINTIKKEIIIEDNATGIKAAEAVTALKNIAQSTKKRGIDKGFRGIGRLGGLGYCEELMFETSYQGEPIKTIMIWNAKDLKAIINDRDNKEEASQVIDAVTIFDSEKEEVDKHYFKVTMVDVSNDELLDLEKIRDYLSMVAPVPFDSHFILKSKINDYTTEYGVTIDEYQINVNHEQVVKAYSTVLKKGNKSNEVTDLKFFEYTTPTKEIILWGWYGISKFEWYLHPKLNLARGIRLRKNNIQIGSETTLVKLHRENRGNFYFIGEVHATHMDLIPNARRDYFSENKILKFFENKLKDLFHEELYNLYYFASNVRSEQNKLSEYQKKLDAYDEKSKKGFSSKEESETYHQDLLNSEEKANIAKNNLLKLKDKARNSAEQKTVFKAITISVEEESELPSVTELEVTIKQPPKKIKYWVDELPSLNKKDRKLVSKVFNTIEKNLAVSEDIIDNLKEKIIQEFQ